MGIIKYNQISWDQCGDVQFRIPLKEHTTFRIGGDCDVMLSPRTEEEVVRALTILREHKIRHMILGNGSNVLFDDKGYRGVIVKLDKNLSKIRIVGRSVDAQAGALLSVTAKTSMEQNLTGMEFASGIPGSIGGAIFMNAGAYGSEIADIFVSAKIIDENLEIREVGPDEIAFGYRKSAIQAREWVVLSSKFFLREGDPAEISRQFEDFTHRRVSKQPLNFPSAGSTFKRPEGGFASKMIDDAGLRGLRCRGAAVSEKHCGFIVNDREATAQDVRELIEMIRERVYEKFGVYLEPEVRVIGEKE